MFAVRTPLRHRALKLPARQRMNLSVLLLESREDKTDSVAQLKQLNQRSAELHSGKVKALTTEQTYGFLL